MWFYGRFLSINRASTAPTMMIATMMPATAGTKYMSATDSAGAAVGAGVAGAGSTTNARLSKTFSESFSVHKQT